MKTLHASLEGERQGHLVFKAKDLHADWDSHIFINGERAMVRTLDRVYTGTVVSSWYFPKDHTHRFMLRPAGKTVKKALPAGTRAYTAAILADARQVTKADAPLASLRRFFGGQWG